MVGRALDEHLRRVVHEWAGLAPRNRPVVGPDGALYIAYVRSLVTVTPFAPQTAPIQLVVARSTDGGQTFQGYQVDDDIHRVTSPDEATPKYTEMIPAIAADPGHAGRLAVAWPEANGSDQLADHAALLE